MRTIGPSLAIKFFGIAALAATVILTLNYAAAQSSSQNRQAGQWDRWSPNWMQRDGWGTGQMGPGMQQRMARHWTFMHQGIPAKYRGAVNPLSPNAKTIGEGHALYQARCASCRGATGMGDGEAGKSLNPSPALLAYMIQMPMSVDEYLLWSVSDGGAGFKTDMPAFKNELTQDEIWKIVTYMRAGFPDN